MIEFWEPNLNNGLWVGVITIELSKAFDSLVGKPGGIWFG